MVKNQSSQLTGEQLHERLSHLEELNRWHQHTLNVIGALCNIYQQPAHAEDPLHILKETVPFILQVAPVQAIGFCSLKSAEIDIQMSYVNLEKYRTDFNKDLETLIEKGHFSWALNTHFPQIYTVNTRTLILISVSTLSDTKGMFLAYIDNDKPLKEHHKKGIYAIVQHCAYALESHELQQVIQNQNEQLIKSFVSKTIALKEQKNLDRLTLLPNRKILQSAIALSINEAATNHSKLGLILINLDLFKRINGCLGHDAGDKLLQQVSRRLEKSLETCHTIEHTGINHKRQYHIIHLGGDEFCILLSGIYDRTKVKAIMLQISADLSRHYYYGQQEINQTFSAGICVYPDDTHNPEHLLQYANLALDQAKARGRNQFLFYSSDKQSRGLNQIQLSRRLHQALSEEQFRLHYQPQIDIKTKRITGVEALIRWLEPNGDHIPPTQFIPLAEDTGLIIPIGNWVIEESCKQLHRFNTAGFYNIPIAINIAAQQFTQSNFLNSLISAVERHKVSPKLIELELTERVVMGDIEEVSETLWKLHQMGFSIALDDFGTGYSSLSYIRRFHIDKLKIDKSFIDGTPTNRSNVAIVTAISSLANDLGIDVIAEGIEQQQQVDFISSINCHHAQGYFYSKALNEDDLMCLLNKQKQMDRKAV